MTTGDTPLLIERRDGYAILTLNRPQALNALSRGLLRALMAATDALEADPAIRALIITGSGRAFCAGMDLKELQSADGPLAEADGILNGTSLNAIRHLANFTGPIVAAVNGPAITGGFELALAADVILASTAARFADTHARVGIVPGGGVSQILSRVIAPYRAKELSLTGNFISGETASAWGLVNRVVEPDQLLPTAEALVREMLDIDDGMSRRYKRLIDNGFAVPFGEAMALEEQESLADTARITSEEIGRRSGAIVGRGRVQTGK